jgi:hypothetical protein
MPRIVTGSLVKANTNPIEDVYIYFRPMAILAYTTASDMVDLTPLEVVTDSLGSFSLTLYTEEDFDTTSSEYIYTNMAYRIEIPSLGIVRLVTVPAGTADIDWNALGTEVG